MVNEKYHGLDCPIRNQRAFAYGLQQREVGK